jgi:hypothetical protein
MLPCCVAAHSGYYALALAHPTEHMVACRLLELYRQQAAGGLVQAPTALCFTSCVLDGREVERGNPFKMAVPREGVLQVGRRGWPLLAAGRRSLLRLADCFLHAPAKLTDAKSTAWVGRSACAQPPCFCLPCLQLNFVDLRPVPSTAQPLSREQFAVLLALLTSARPLRGKALEELACGAEVATKVGGLARKGHADWPGTLPSSHCVGLALHRTLAAGIAQ